ncbi:MAG: hypothetical protein ABI667_07810 [Sphingomicrobium sp.]
MADAIAIRSVHLVCGPSPAPLMSKIAPVASGNTSSVSALTVITAACAIATEPPNANATARLSHDHFRDFVIEAP